MAVVRIHKIFVSPDGREEVELFGPKNGLYGFRLWECKRKAWRRITEACQFSCYVSVCYDPGEQIGWLRCLPAYDLEHLRGLSFAHADYTVIRFGSDHDHCVACPAKFMESGWPNELHVGFVARCPIPHGSGAWAWVWVCEQCFPELRTEMQWQLE